MTGPATLPLRFVGFVLWYIGQVFRSAGMVLRDIATPGRQATPRVVRVPLQSWTDAQVVGIGALITLTPGTLTLGVIERDGGRDLLVHSMYDADNPSAVAALRDMEARMLNAVTIRGGFRP